MTKSKFLNALRPVLEYLPEIPTPKRYIEGHTRLTYTVLTLVLFLICCQIPVFGHRPSRSSDPFYWMRAILASNKGTIMELGISPLVSASLLLQVLCSVGIIDADENKKEDKGLYNGAQKLLGLVITFIEASAFIFSGMYGDVRDIGIPVCLGILAQFMISGLVCLMLDELLQKGYGYGSGISLFIACNICETIVWKCFSFMTHSFGHGQEFEGAIIGFFHLLFVRSNKFAALREAFHRSHLPNMSNVIATVLVFVVVMFLQGFKVDLMVNDPQGRQREFPIKLFYTSNMPIILQSALISNLYFMSQILAKRFEGNLFVDFLGKWRENEYAGTASGSTPVGGLSYYVTPPASLWRVWEDPVHALLYVAIILTSCALFSKAWIELAGQSPRDVAKQLREQKLTIPGARDQHDAEAALRRYIPIAAAFGGLCVGLLSVVADFLGAIGSGTGILLAVTMINSYYEQLQREGHLRMFS